MKFLHLTWNDIQRLSENVAEQIRKANYRPDMIVAISRGGFPPARILCDQLDIMNLTSLKIEYYTGVRETKSKPVIVYPLNADVKDKKVLISDDVADTGHSLVAAKGHILEKGASDVKIAALHYKPWSVIKPDFYAETVDAWIVYPWEVRETAKQLISKFRNEGKNVEETREQLLDLGFKEKTLKGLLSQFY